MALQSDAKLAVEVFQCQRLIKGYSDTHERAHSKFGTVMDALQELVGRPDASQWLARLREAALEDEQGMALQSALASMNSNP